MQIIVFFCSCANFIFRSFHYWAVVFDTCLTVLNEIVTYLPIMIMRLVNHLSFHVYFMIERPANFSREGPVHGLLISREN